MTVRPSTGASPTVVVAAVAAAAVAAHRVLWLVVRVLAVRGEVG